jgi:hypothetical protein
MILHRSNDDIAVVCNVEDVVVVLLLWLVVVFEAESLQAVGRQIVDDSTARPMMQLARSN